MSFFLREFANDCLDAFIKMGSQWRMIWPGALIVLAIFFVLVGLMLGLIDPESLMI